MAEASAVAAAPAEAREEVREEVQEEVEGMKARVLTEVELKERNRQCESWEAAERQLEAARLLEVGIAATGAGGGNSPPTLPEDSPPPPAAPAVPAGPESSAGPAGSASPESAAGPASPGPLASAGGRQPADLAAPEFAGGQGGQPGGVGRALGGGKGEQPEGAAVLSAAAPPPAFASAAAAGETAARTANANGAASARTAGGGGSGGDQVPGGGESAEMSVEGKEEATGTSGEAQLGGGPLQLQLRAAAASGDVLGGESASSSKSGHHKIEMAADVAPASPSPSGLGLTRGLEGGPDRKSSGEWSDGSDSLQGNGSTTTNATATTTTTTTTSSSSSSASSSKGSSGSSSSRSSGILHSVGSLSEGTGEAGTLIASSAGGNPPQGPSLPSSETSPSLLEAGGRGGRHVKSEAEERPGQEGWWQQRRQRQGQGLGQGPGGSANQAARRTGDDFGERESEGAGREEQQQQAQQEEKQQQGQKLQEQEQGQEQGQGQGQGQPQPQQQQKEQQQQQQRRQEEEEGEVTVSSAADSADDVKAQAAARFERNFLRLLRGAQFEGLSARDLQLTTALNTDYLLNLPIDVDWRRASSSNAILFRRGYTTERQEGRLLGAKFDYVQSRVLQGLLSFLTRPLLQAGRMATKRWKRSLKSPSDGSGSSDGSSGSGSGSRSNAWGDRLRQWLQEPLHPGDEDWPAEPSNLGREKAGALPIRSAIPRYEAVLSSAGSRGMLLRRLLVFLGLLPPRPPDALADPAELPAPRRRKPHLRPRYVNRVAMRDIWRPASKAVCGSSLWLRLKALLSVAAARSVLQEPAFGELVLLYTKEDPDGGSQGKLQLNAYKDIPVPNLKVVFPDKRLSFRGVDTVRLDLATVVGLLAFVVNYRFEDFLSSPSAFALDVVATVSLTLFLSRALLAYKQTWDRYQLLVNKTLYEKTVANGFGVVHFLVDASEEQQFKEAALAYAVLLHAGRPLSVKELGDECERFLHRRFNEQIEMPVHDTASTLLRLGLATLSSPSSGPPPEGAAGKGREQEYQKPAQQQQGEVMLEAAEQKGNAAPPGPSGQAAQEKDEATAGSGSGSGGGSRVKRDEGSRHGHLPGWERGPVPAAAVPGQPIADADSLTQANEIPSSPLSSAALVGALGPAPSSLQVAAAGGGGIAVAAVGEDRGRRGGEDATGGNADDAEEDAAVAASGAERRALNGGVGADLTSGNEGEGVSWRARSGSFDLLGMAMGLTREKRKSGKDGERAGMGSEGPGESGGKGGGAGGRAGGESGGAGEEAKEEEEEDACPEYLQGTVLTAVGQEVVKVRLRKHWMALLHRPSPWAL